MRMGWLKICATASAVLLSHLLALPSDARGRRPVFDPEDLDMQDSGIVQLNALGGAQSDGGGFRIIAPDWELNVAVTDRLELGIDGALSLVFGKGLSGSPAQAQADNIWLSAKHLLVDIQQGKHKNAWAIGLQHGPRLPFAPDTYGLGYQVLGLVSRNIDQLRVVLNFGAFADPKVTGLVDRPLGLLAGLDATLLLDAAGIWELDPDLSFARYSDGTSEASASILPQFRQSVRLDLGVQVLGGWLAGRPGWGAVALFAPNLQLRQP